jgi:hypothetical protein
LSVKQIAIGGKESRIESANVWTIWLALKFIDFPLRSRCLISNEAKRSARSRFLMAANHAELDKSDIGE